VEVEIHLFLTSALNRSRCSFSLPGQLIAGQSVCVLDILEESILPVLGIRPCFPCHASCSLVTTLTTLFRPHSTVKDSQCTYKRKNKERLRNNFCCEQIFTIKYSKCLSVVLTIQYAQRLYLVMWSSMVSPTVLYFSTLSHKWHGCRKKLIGHKMCYNFLYKAIFKSVRSVSETFLIIKRIQRKIVINMSRYFCKIRIIIAGF
jgi:hypothetical protein